MTWPMFFIELAVAMPLAVLWVTLVHALGFAFPFGSVTWFILCMVWSFSPWATTFRDKLWEKLHG